MYKRILTIILSLAVGVSTGIAAMHSDSERIELVLANISGGTSTPTPKPTCDPVQKINAAIKALEPTILDVGAKQYSYTEIRVGKEISFQDPEKQIALELLDSDSCTLRQIIITKRGDELIAPEGYEIEAIRRANGIRWNNWATDYSVKKPEGLIVLANKYPLVQGSTVTPVFYTSYNAELPGKELLQDGQEYLAELSSRAFSELRTRNVHSQAFPDTLIADVSLLRPEYIARLVPIEHMDMTEFLLDPAWTIKRVHVIIGANRERMGTFTCSPATACGPMQFTEGTYELMDQLYPDAGLMDDFSEGARNPLNAAMAAVLLHDHNLAQLKEQLSLKAFAALTADASMLEEVLASAYNTGVGRTLAVLRTFYANPKRFSDWAEAKGTGSRERLATETKGYIAKLRYLRDQ